MFYYILGERVERIISETVEKDVQIITLPIMVNAFCYFQLVTLTPLVL